MAPSCTEGGNRGKPSSSPACRSLLPLHFLHAMCSKGPGPGVHWVTCSTAVTSLQAKSRISYKSISLGYCFISQIFSPLTCSDLLSILKTSLANESKTTLGRQCFGPSNVCMFIYLALDFFKRKQFIVLQPQPACFPSFNQTHLFFHLWFSATGA